MRKIYFVTPEQCSPLAPSGQRVVTSVLGYKGVEANKGKTKFRAYIGCRKQDNLIRTGWFEDIKDAAQAYDQLARDRYGVDAFVNFPLNGEKAVIKKKDGFCSNGHELTDINILPPRDGRGVDCRICKNIKEMKYQRKIGRVSYERIGA